MKVGEEEIENVRVVAGYVILLAVVVGLAIRSILSLVVLLYMFAC
jgi:hypothetical protein